MANAFLQAVTDEQKAKAAEHVKVCSGEAKVTPAELAAAKTNVDTKDPKLQVCNASIVRGRWHLEAIDKCENLNFVPFILEIRQMLLREGRFP